MADISAWEREEALSELRRGAKPEAVAERYGMLVTSVYRMMQRHGIPRRRWRRWTPEEDELIRRFYPSHGGAWSGWGKLMPEREPTRADVNARAHALGVRRDASK